MKIYISGPMRGIKDFNFPAFDAAERKWRAEGHIAFSPAQTDRALGYVSGSFECDLNQLKHLMLSDIACLYHADAIALLPGWERSKGATVELALAQFLGLKVFDAMTGVEIHPTLNPWNNNEVQTLCCNKA